MQAVLHTTRHTLCCKLEAVNLLVYANLYASVTTMTGLSQLKKLTDLNAGIVSIENFRRFLFGKRLDQLSQPARLNARRTGRV